MKYLSICSGIEAATAAWHSLGWEPLAFSEIEKFPSAVLAHHYPTITNEGDFTNIGDKYDLSNGLLVGGTPCQSFSVAGLREGLADERGNLALEYLKLARDSRAQWVVWENVPGVLSSWTNGPSCEGDDGEGRLVTQSSDFASFLGGLSELGYGWAYRVLDAQFFGVAQRRRRVFVVGCLGSWQRAGAVLFESSCLSGNPAPSRQTRQEPSRTLAIGIDEEVNASEEVFGPLLRGGQGGTRQAVAYKTTGAGFWQEGLGTLRAREQDSHENIVCMATGQAGAEISENQAPCLNCNHEAPIVVHGTQDPLTSDIAFPLGRNNGAENVLVFTQNQSGDVLTGDIAPALSTNSNATGRNTAKALIDMVVRRLTPVECERVQGFHDNFTRIPWGGKPAIECPDGHRYKALGNSIAVPVLDWLGRRIEAVDNIHRKTTERATNNEG